MNKSNQTEIIESAYKNDKLVRYVARRVVVKSGSGGAITLPKALIGKVIFIDYSEVENETTNAKTN